MAAGYEEYIRGMVPAMSGPRGFGGGNQPAIGGGITPRTPIGPPPQPGLGQGGFGGSGNPGPGYGVIGDVNSPTPSPGLGMGTPGLQTYEDYSMGYPGTASANPMVHPQGAGDPLLILLQMLINQRFPNGM